MKIKNFLSEAQAYRYAHAYMMKGRIVGVMRKNGKWQVKVLASGQR